MRDTAFALMLRLGSAQHPILSVSKSDPDSYRDEHPKSLQIAHPRMYPFNVVTDIKHNTGEDVNYKREAYR